MRKFLTLLLALVSVHIGAQDLAHYKNIVKELSSSKYQGRGYAEDGAKNKPEYDKYCEVSDEGMKYYSQFEKINS